MNPIGFVLLFGVYAVWGLEACGWTALGVVALDFAFAMTNEFQKARR